MSAPVAGQASAIWKACMPHVVFSAVPSAALLPVAPAGAQPGASVSYAYPGPPLSELDDSDRGTLSDYSQRDAPDSATSPPPATHSRPALPPRKRSSRPQRADASPAAPSSHPSTPHTLQPSPSLPPSRPATTSPARSRPLPSTSALPEHAASAKRISTVDNPSTSELLNAVQVLVDQCQWLKACVEEGEGARTAPVEVGAGDLSLVLQLLGDVKSLVSSRPEVAAPTAVVAAAAAGASAEQLAEHLAERDRWAQRAEAEERKSAELRRQVDERDAQIRQLRQQLFDAEQQRRDAAMQVQRSLLGADAERDRLRVETQLLQTENEKLKAKLADVERQQQSAVAEASARVEQVAQWRRQAERLQMELNGSEKRHAQLKSENVQLSLRLRSELASRDAAKEEEPEPAEPSACDGRLEAIVKRLLRREERVGKKLTALKTQLSAARRDKERQRDRYEREIARLGDDVQELRALFSRGLADDGRVVELAAHVLRDAGSSVGHTRRVGARLAAMQHLASRHLAAVP